MVADESEMNDGKDAPGEPAASAGRQRAGALEGEKDLLTRLP